MTRGNAVYTTPGSYEWTCPDGVTTVCAICIGGGGGAQYDTGSYGGGGGALAWINHYPVTPGQTYALRVGAGGSLAENGEQSFFIDAATLIAMGGLSGNNGGTGGTGYYDNSYEGFVG